MILDINVAQKENYIDTDINDTKMITDAIKHNDKVTRIELANLIGKSVKTAERIIKESPNIKHFGSAKKGYWVIEDNDDF